MRHNYRMSETDMGGGGDTVLRGRFLYNEPMCKHVSWRAGGAARRVYIPADLEDLAWLVRSIPAHEPIHMVGLGSNLLVRDAGIRGVVVCPHGALGKLERLDATHVRAEAGVPCARLGRQAVKWGLGPASFFAGLPGPPGT